MTLETRLVDYSFARPHPDAIAAAGYVGVLRYLGGSKEKQLTAAEAKQLHRAGLAIGLVYEAGAQRAGLGRAAGAADARAAIAAAEKLGYPVTCPIFLAVDYDTQVTAAVAGYFAGAKTVLGTRLGVYGGIKVMGLNVAWKWQTAAWSKGQLSHEAHLFQRVKPNGPLPAGCDEDVVCAPVHLWGRKGVVTLAPPLPAPAAKPAGPVTRGPDVDNSLSALRKVRDRATAQGRTRRAGIAQQVIRTIKKLFPGKKG